MTKSKVNLLLITFEFPPAGGGTVQRLTKMVKYLSQNGIRPTVLTVKSEYYSQTDQSYLKDIPPEVKLYRINTFFSKSYTNEIRDKSLSGSSFKINKNIGLRLKILWFLRNNFLIPDTQILWLPYVLMNIKNIIKEENIGVIYATSGPNSVSVIGAIVACLFKKRFVAEFRDPWVQWDFRVWENAFRKYVETKMEKWVVGKADLIVSTTEAMRDYYSIRYKRGLKSICIYNGFDSGDFKNLKSQHSKVFTFVYTGKIIPDLYSPLPFLKIIKEIIFEQGANVREFKIVFLGDFPDIYRNWIKENALHNYIDVKGYVPHREAILYQLGADILLLLLEPEVGVELTISGKFFEYLFAQKFILGIMPESSRVNEELKKFGAGKVFSQDKLDELKNFLIDVLVHKNDYILTIEEKREQALFFEWKNQFKNLSYKLLELLNTHA